MNTKLLATGLICCAATVSAQLSSPIKGAQPLPGAPKAAVSSSAAAKGAASASVAGVPAGQGAGVHGANSPFAKLEDRAGIVPWSVLTAVKTKVDNKKIVPVYTADQTALNQKSQKIQGFMMPLEPGEKQRHFLLTSVPMSCGFCLPGGPESMVEVRTKTAVKYTLEPVVVEGKFNVLADDPYGLYYRVTDAVLSQ